MSMLVMTVRGTSGGSIAANAVETIDQCFAAVHRHSDRFDPDLRGLGWQPPSSHDTPDDSTV
jgi:hypothetical protein